MQKSPKKPKAPPKPKAPKKVKAPPTERELVERYAQKIRNAATSTMVDRKDLHAIAGKEFKKTATMLGLDKDFYFTVVFQSGDQKYEFLKKVAEKFGFKIEGDDKDLIEFLNGPKFASALGIEVKKEPLHGFPVPDPLLLPFVLGNT